MRANVVELSQASDPKEYIFDKTKGALKGHVTLGDRVLVATYIAPSVTSGGIIRPDSCVEEDRHQSKVGLVLDMGPLAFKYEGQFEYEGPTPKIGDWVQYYPSDGREFFLGAKEKDGGVPCRKISSQLISGIVKNPDTIY